MNDNTEHSCSGNTPEKCEILALLVKYHRNYNGIFKAKGRERLLDYLNNYSPLLGESHNIITKLYWLVHDIHDFPACEVCGKPITGNIKHFDSGYCNPPCVHIYCSSKCAQNSPTTHELHDQTCIERYGITHFVNPEKAKVTCQDRYGVDNVFQLESVIKKSEETKTDRYGDPHYTNNEKREATNLQKYGATNVFASEYGKNKIKETLQNRLGVDNPMQSEEVQSKTSQTNIERYGSKHTVTACSIRDKIEHALMKNYGSTSFFGSDEFKRRTMEQYGVPHMMMVPEIHNKSVRHRRGKIRYNGVGFDTIPELAFFLYMTDNFKGMSVLAHPDNFFEYEHNGKTHKYWPDFKVNDTFVEIKGKQFFRQDGTMYCPYRKKDMSDLEYAELCDLFEAKRQCMITNNVVIFSNDEYEIFIQYMKSNYNDLYMRLKYHSSKSKQ